MDPNNIFGDIKFNDVILWLLALATLVGIVESNGWLPPFIAKWLARNRLESTLAALKKLDVRIAWDDDRKRISLSQRVLDKTGIKKLAYKVELEQLLEEDTFVGKFNIGATTHFSGEEFIDVMGSSTDPDRAVRYAKILKTHLKVKGIATFDVVATPRSGSPILGYEFAKLSNKPFVTGLHSKVSDINKSLGAHNELDFARNLKLDGANILIVDDSTTGGRKQVELIDKLRSAGAIVTESLILFEPQGKGARERLKGIGVTLHSVQLGPVGNH